MREVSGWDSVKSGPWSLQMLTLRPPSTSWERGKRRCNLTWKTKERQTMFQGGEGERGGGVRRAR